MLKFILQFEVLDTWGTPSGDLHGNSFSVGLFDECRNFTHENIQGKYCTAQFLFKKFQVPQSKQSYDIESFFQNVMFRNGQIMKLGICVPQTCQEKQLTRIGAKFLAESTLQLGEIKCFQPPILGNFDYFLM